MTAPPGDVFVAVIADIVNLAGNSKDECVSFMTVTNNKISLEPIYISTDDGKLVQPAQMNCVPSSGQYARHTFYFQFSESELTGKKLAFGFYDLPLILLAISK